MYLKFEPFKKIVLVNIFFFSFNLLNYTETNPQAGSEHYIDFSEIPSWQKANEVPNKKKKPALTYCNEKSVRKLS